MSLETSPQYSTDSATDFRKAVLNWAKKWAWIQLWRRNRIVIISSLGILSGAMPGILGKKVGLILLLIYVSPGAVYICSTDLVPVIMLFCGLTAIPVPQTLDIFSSRCGEGRLFSTLSPTVFAYFSLCEVCSLALHLCPPCCWPPSG